MLNLESLLEGGFDDSATKDDPVLLPALEKARTNYSSALANDLNTAEAAAAIFELVRIGNAAATAGALRPSTAREILRVLTTFDEVFAVLVDRDAELTRTALKWAEAEGRMGEASAELVTKMGLTDEAIDTLVAERTQAKKTRNFARADAIRAELLAKGVVIEDSKDGVRWKRK